MYGLLWSHMYVFTKKNGHVHDTFLAVAAKMRANIESLYLTFY